MRLAELSLRLGPVNLPVALLLVAAGIVVVAVFQHTALRSEKERWGPVNERISAAVLIGFAVWKLTPIVTRTSEIVESPLRLVWYAGGSVGLIAGAIAGLLFVALRTVFSREIPTLRDTLIHGAVILAGPVLLVGVGFLIPVESGSRIEYSSLTFLDGYEASPEAGQPAVLVFWATWCGPCTAQMPEVQRASERLSGRADVIAVNMSYSEPDLSVVHGYLEANGFTLPVATDSSGALTGHHEVGATPTTIVFRADGRERVRRVGAVNADWIVRRVLQARN